MFGTVTNRGSPPPEEEPDEGQDRGDKEHGGNRDIDEKTVPLDPDVAREASKERNLPPQEEPEQNEDHSGDHKKLSQAGEPFHT